MMERDLSADPLAAPVTKEFRTRRLSISVIAAVCSLSHTPLREPLAERRSVIMLIILCWFYNKFNSNELRHQVGLLCAKIRA